AGKRRGSPLTGERWQSRWFISQRYCVARVAPLNCPARVLFRSHSDAAPSRTPEMSLQRYAAVVTLCVASALISAHAADNRKIEIDTTEGTWMSLDVSPDGRQIVFDL